jgi:ATP-dependent Clp protease, protease subunit
MVRIEPSPYQSFNLGKSMETPSPTPQTEQRSNFLEEKAFKSRKVLLFGEINDTTASDTVRRLLALSAESDEPIDLLVSSPGGHVESGDAIHDIIRYISAPVTMIGTGWVGSAAAHVYLAVPRERRVCLPNTRFLIHQPSGGAGGRATDIAIQAREIVKIRERIASVIARETGKLLETVLLDIDRDHWLTAQEAVSYGLVSRIVEHQSELRK